MKAGAKFQQRSDPTHNLSPALVGAQDAGQAAQQRAFTASIAAYKTERGSLRYIKTHAAKRPELVVRSPTAVQDRRFDGRVPVAVEPELLAEIFHDDGRRHSSSANLTSNRRKMA
jgi:hypothetical protein